MSSKFQKIENTNLQKGIFVNNTISASNPGYIDVDGSVDWNSSTIVEKVYPILDQDGNPIMVPLGAFFGGNNKESRVLLKQVGDDFRGTEESSTLEPPTLDIRGSTIVSLLITNQVNGEYQGTEITGVIKPLFLGLDSESAFDISPINGGLGFRIHIAQSSIRINKFQEDVEIQNLFLCAKFYSELSNQNSKLQVSTRIYL